MKYSRKIFGAAVIVALASLVFWLPSDMASTPSQAGSRNMAGALLGPSSQQQALQIEQYVSEPVTPVLTSAASDAPPPSHLPTLDREINPRMSYSARINPDFVEKDAPDPLLPLQQAAPPAQPDAFGTPIFNFNGQGYTFLNPPDTVGDVGANHYVQMINATDVAVYNKNTGALIQAFSLTSLGGCTTGGGDPIVLYDQLADRWFLSEFGSGSSLCVLISQTADPLGAYYSYRFVGMPSFPDYPKYGVWPDAYYATANESSPSALALDRTKMLAGLPATFQRFTAVALSGFPFQALTPADLDGMTPPPAGAPDYIMRHRDTEIHGPSGFPNSDILEIYAFHVDWTTPANSTFTKLPDIQTAEFDSTLCGQSSFSCMGMPGVPQGSGSSLDPIREVIMHRLAYRKFSGYETLVGNFVTDIGNDYGGVRWFELRKVGSGNWSLYQEGTYAPTTTDNRWMGGIAMDGAGNIALGYNVSSQTVYPSLRYVGRLASDPLGTMPQGEYTLINGTGVNGSNRYGDYASMSIDPIDDCTFWFTGEWNATSQWSTRIGAFKFDACGTPDFTISAAPATQDVCVGTPAAYTVNIGSVSGYNSPVTLSASGNPGTAGFSTNPVTPPGSSTMTISGAAAGSYNFDVVGTATGPNVHQAPVGLNVLAAAPAAPVLLSPANGATSVSTTPTFTWNAVAGAASYSIQVATDAGFTNVVASASGLTSPTWTSNVTLSATTTYYWRVWASNACGVGSYSAVWSFTTAAIVCNTAAITIPDSGVATPYPSNIAISGQGTALTDVNVYLQGLSHTYPDDIDMLLVGPQGQNLIIMSDAGGGTDVVNADVTFDDAAASQIPDGGPLVTGTYKPSNWGTGDTFPAPAPAPSAATTLATFNTTNPNGTWSLYVVDDAGGDTGSIAEGWCLELATEQPPTAVTLSSMDAGQSPAPVPVGVPVAALPAVAAAAMAAVYTLRRRR